MKTGPAAAPKINLKKSPIIYSSYCDIKTPQLVGLGCF